MVKKWLAGSGCKNPDRPISLNISFCNLRTVRAHYYTGLGDKCLLEGTRVIGILLLLKLQGFFRGRVNYCGFTSLGGTGYQDRTSLSL